MKQWEVNRLKSIQGTRVIWESLEKEKKQTNLNHEFLYEEFCSEFLFACNMGMLKLKW